MTEKTHYRKAFDSPYLSSADITEPTTLTIARVTLEKDKTKKTKDQFNTAYFVERQIRQDEPLKPMVLNATNSKMLSKITGSKFIDDWQNVRITVYVDENVRFGNGVVEGLRLMPAAPADARRPVLTPDSKRWNNAKQSYLNTGSLDAVLKHCDMSEEHQAQLIRECAQENQDVA